jgi:hypothetical protein
MMDSQLYTKINSLPPALKAEVSNFIDYLLSKRIKVVQTKQPKFGSTQGQFKMPIDFDEPLDDFKEYMP